MPEGAVQIAPMQPAKLWTRPNRVATLVGVVVLLSIADLYMTLMHLTTIGMLEANPLARWIMQNLSPAAVVAWKFATLAIAGMILLKMRTKACGEIAAWICALVLIWLMARWTTYADHLANYSADQIELVAGDTGAWVVTEPAS